MSPYHGMIRQIGLGSLVLFLSGLVHILVLQFGISLLVSLMGASGPEESAANNLLIVCLSFVIIVSGHTIQVWLWALSLIWRGALKEVDDAMYFALVTTTTLGYGDVTLPRPHRIFGAMAAVSGLLNFGLSTAFLIGAVEALFRSAV